MLVFKIKKLKYKFAEIFIPLSFVLFQYKFFFLNIGLIILLVFLAYYVTKKSKIKIYIPLLVFCTLATVLSLISCFTSENRLITSLNFIFLQFVIIFGFGALTDDINFENLYNVYKFIGFIAILGILYHSVVVYVMGGNVDPITILPITDTANWAFKSYRPVSFFQEPQAFATYIIPLLTIALDKKHYKYAIFISISILLSASTQGAIACAIVWTIFMAYNKKFKHAVIVLVIATILLYLYMTLDVFSLARNKLLNAGKSYSDFLRLYKGYFTFTEMPLINKIFGIGQWNLENFIDKSTVHFSWQSMLSRKSWGYMSTAFGVFVEFGLIGGISFYSMIFCMFMKKSHISNTLLVIMLIQMVSQTIFFNGTFFLYILLILTALDAQKRALHLQGVKQSINMR